MAEKTDPAAFFRDMMGHWEKMGQAIGAGFPTPGAPASGGIPAPVQALVDRALAAAHVPTRAEIDALTARIARLEAEIARRDAVVPPAPKPKQTRLTKSKSARKPKPAA